MGAGILTLLPILLSLARADAPAPASGGADTTMRTMAADPAGKTDSVKSEPGKASLLPANPPVRGLVDSTPAWIVPMRDGSPGGAAREAFRGGDMDAPWVKTFEFDGMWEEWSSWPSLPSTEKLVRPGWTGPSLAGTSDAGPLQTVSVARETESGFGGQRLRKALVAPSPLDTPMTQVHFWRGALASYRFGMDFSRAVAGPWGVALRMETRSSQGREWIYRDQIPDMFQGSLGRTRDELPAKGRSVGQDDVQWEALVSRATPGLLAELGWTWVDLRRGVPHPFNRWNGNLLPPYEGRDRRSGWFGRILSRSGDLDASLSGRAVGQDWARAAWTDSGAPVPVTGTMDVQEGEFDVSWGGSVFRAGLVGRASLRTGTSDLRIGTLQEDLERGGLRLEWNGASWRSRGEFGWSRLNDPWNRTWNRPDASVSVDHDGALDGGIRLALESRLPDWEITVLPDPLLASIPSANLSPEGRWIGQAHLGGSLFRWLALDAGFAGVFLQDAIQPARVPTESSFLLDGRSAMRLANAAGEVVGWSSRLGARAALGGASISTQWSIGATYAPGQPLGGTRDLRYPTVNSRSSAGWEGPMLQGRAKAASILSLRTWSSSMMSCGDDGSGAILVRQPPGGTLDWENRFSIRTFEIFWRLENLLDDRQIPAAGWTPPGIRSGWGVTWNFGG